MSWLLRALQRSPWSRQWQGYRPRAAGARSGRLQAAEGFLPMAAALLARVNVSALAGVLLAAGAAPHEPRPLSDSAFRNTTGLTSETASARR